jgi:isoleucyl-tRNA synthetase
VRQPLGRLLVKPANEVERAALTTPGLRDQLLEELNVKALELVESTAGLVEVEVKPNFKTLGPKYGPLMKRIQAELATADPLAVQEAIARGAQFPLAVDGTEVLLGAAEVEVRQTPAAGLAVTFAQGAFVALDTTITPELRLEGVARDFVRGVQAERKALDLDVADRIRLRYRGGDEVRQAVAEWEAYIRRETLAVSLEADEALEGTPQFKAGGEGVWVSVERAERGPA